MAETRPETRQTGTCEYIKKERRVDPLVEIFMKDLPPPRIRSAAFRRFQTKGGQWRQTAEVKGTRGRRALNADGLWRDVGWCGRPHPDDVNVTHTLTHPTHTHTKQS